MQARQSSKSKILSRVCVVILQREVSLQVSNYQENQCLRAGKCNNAALGEQKLGNDKAVTGFADQSKNVQSRIVVTPTPIVNPTPKVTPTPIPTGCPPDNVLDVTLQGDLNTGVNGTILPEGTTLCLPLTSGTQIVTVIGTETTFL